MAYKPSRLGLKNDAWIKALHYLISLGHLWQTSGNEKPAKGRFFIEVRLNYSC